MNENNRVLWMVLTVLIIIIILLVTLMSVTTGAQAATPYDLLIQNIIAAFIDLRDRVIVLESYHDIDPYPGPSTELFLPTPTTVPECLEPGIGE
jgi:hypothetical protein